MRELESRLVGWLKSYNQNMYYLYPLEQIINALYSYNNVHDFVSQRPVLENMVHRTTGAAKAVVSSYRN